MKPPEEARFEASAGKPSGFAAQVLAGEVMHLWQKPVGAAAGSHVLVWEANGEARDVCGPLTDDFQMTVHQVGASGKISVKWDETETSLSICYAYDPRRVVDDGIRVLWASSDASAGSKRFRLHLAPPFGWMNDPNGMIRVGGHLHAFYQHYPHARHWDSMHWGHAATRNLVDWTHLPVFLHPRAAILDDRGRKGGAYSGSAIARAEGGLRIFHTDREDGRVPEQEWQMTAISSDLISAGPSTVVIGERPPLAGIGRDLRDPYVFKGPDGLWKMVLGGHSEEAALVLLYETADPGAAGDWHFVGVLHSEPLPRPVPAECPCVIALDGEGKGLHALVFGLIGHQSLVKGRLNPSFALVGRFDGKRFEEVARRELDFVGDCYAFQSFWTESGPAGLAWAANWADVRRTQDFPSAMTFVRRLVWQGGALLMPPIDTVTELRQQRLANSIEQLQRGVKLPNGLAEIEFEVAGGAAFSLALTHPDCPMALAGDGGELEFIADWARPPARGIRCVAKTGPLRQVRVFIDVGLIEIYADGGRLCGTKRVDSDKPVTAVQLDATSESVRRVEVWQLRAQTGAYR